MAKDNKTSKTARVMNLLSKKPDPAAPQEEAAPASGSAPAAPPAPAPAVPPIVASMAPDAAVSVQIRNALEDALEGELGAQQPAAPAPEGIPASKASFGVATRVWSPMAAPCGRTPGVTMKASGPRSSRSGRASRGDATTPDMPDSLAREAMASTCDSTGRSTPTWCRVSCDMDVSTVMPSVAGTSAPASAAPAMAPRWAASIMGRPPMVCMVSMSAPASAALRAAPSTWCGMS